MAVRLRRTRTCPLAGCECRTPQAPTTGTFPQAPHSGSRPGPWRRDPPAVLRCDLWAGWRYQRRKWLLAGVVLPLITASDSCPTRNTISTTRLASGARWVHMSGNC
ncbi:hypothetical protein PO909_022100 [Leuciscus waleckii]